MTSSRSTTVLYVVVATVLLALTVLVWIFPATGSATDTPTRAATAPTASTDSGRDPCDLVIGSAKDFCKRDRQARGSAPAGTSTASRAIATAPSRVLILVPASAAVAAAIGLVLMAERRSR